jgi:hypothetical protein
MTFSKKTSLVFLASLASFYIGVSLSFRDKISAIVFSLPS